jgi:hypothetical protein
VPDMASSPPQHARNAFNHNNGRGRLTKPKQHKKRGRDVRGMTSLRRAASPGSGAAFAARSDKAARRGNREDKPRPSGANLAPIEADQRRKLREEGQAQPSRSSLSARDRQESSAQDQGQRKRRRVSEVRYATADRPLVDPSRPPPSRPEGRSRSPLFSDPFRGRNASGRGGAHSYTVERRARPQGRSRELLRSPLQRSPPQFLHSRPPPPLDSGDCSPRPRQRHGRLESLPVSAGLSSTFRGNSRSFDHPLSSDDRRRSRDKFQQSPPPHNLPQRQRSRSRRWSPPRHSLDRRRSPAKEPSDRTFNVQPSRELSPCRPASHPQEGRQHLSSRKRRQSREIRHSEPASGGNSGEVTMSSRGGFRGNLNPQGPPPHYGRHQTPQGPQTGDPRRFSQSSGHGTSNSSFQASSPTQSPFSASGRSWNGQQQFSPQQ